MNGVRIYIGNGESLNIWEHGLQSEFACIYCIYIYIDVVFFLYRYLRDSKWLFHTRGS